MKAFTSFLLVFYSANVFAQNLVMNGSFEDYSTCPWSTGQVDSCVYWHGMGGYNINNFLGTPDYFASCAPPVVSVPYNYFGTQEAFEGNAYAGVFTFDYATWYREIIGTQLLDSLVPGKKYEVSVRVSRGNWGFQIDACIASNNLGFRYTTSPYSTTNPPLINNFAHLYCDSIITDSSNWILLNWSFIPDSAYKYVYIGNFFDSPLTDTIQIGCPYFIGRAYYFIDSVNIFCIDEACATGVGSQLNPTLTISPNPASTQINIVYSITQTSTLTITDAYGRVVKQLTLYPYFKNRIVHLEGLAQGVYLVSLEGEKERVSEKLVVQ